MFRMFRRIILLLIITIFFLSSNGFATTIEYKGIVATIKLGYLKQTEIYFPEKIANVVVNVDDNQISIDKAPDRRHMYVSALTEDLNTDVFFISESGYSYQINFIAVKNDERDRSIKITRRELNIEPIKEAKRITPATIIKAMVLDRDVEYISGSDTNDVLIDDVLSDGTKIELKAVKKYDSFYYVGYKVPLNNENIDIRKLINPNLIAASIYRGYLYLVFYKRSWDEKGTTTKYH